MNRIKKMSVIVLLSVISMFSAGCYALPVGIVNCISLSFNRHGFFTQRTLQKAMVPDLPTLPHGEGTYTTADTFYTNASDNVYWDYVNKVYTYLENKGFSYFCYEIGRRESFLRSEYDCSVHSDTATVANYRVNAEENQVEYQFIWSNAVGAGSILENPKVLCIVYYEQPQTEYYAKSVLGRIHKYTYNVKVCFKEITDTINYYLRSN